MDTSYPHRQRRASWVSSLIYAVSCDKLKVSINIKKRDVLLFRHDKSEGGKGRFLVSRLCGEKKRCFREVRGRRTRVEVKRSVLFNLILSISSATEIQAAEPVVAAYYQQLCEPLWFLIGQVSAAGCVSPITSPRSRRQRVPGEGGSK